MSLDVIIWFVLDVIVWLVLFLVSLATSVTVTPVPTTGQNCCATLGSMAETVT